MRSPRRIGVVVPSNNVVLEPEFYSWLPQDVTAHFTRILATGSSRTDLLKMVANIDRAIAELAAAALDVYAYACLSSSLVEDEGWDEAFMSSVEELTGRPAVTAAWATAAALHAVNAERVVLITPYPAEVDALVPPYLRRRGISVVASASLLISNVQEVGRKDPEEITVRTRGIWTSGAEAICVVATDLPTSSVVGPMEAEFGVPVVTTNRALLWACLRSLGIHDAIAELDRPLGPQAHEDIPRS